MPATSPSKDAVSVPRVLAGLVIDYFRWTQLIPMVTAWTFLLLMVGAMLLVSFQQQSFSLIEWGAYTYERVFGPIEPGPPATTDVPAPAAQNDPGGTEDGVIRFSDEDFMPWVLRAWGIAALAGWLVDMLCAAVFGPREPMRLASKLKLAGLPAVACVVLFGIAYLFGSEEFHGSPVGWMLMFTGFPLGVWLVSVYCLSVAHGLDVLRGRLVDPARESRVAARAASYSYNRD